jgi:hypothetical protein
MLSHHDIRDMVSTGGDVVTVGTREAEFRDKFDVIAIDPAKRTRV